MKSANWKDIAELIGIGAIVVSLIFVGSQLRQDRELAEMEGRSSFVANAVELARLFNDNEELWRKGLLDEPLSESEQFKFNGLVRLLYIHRINQFGRRSLNIHGAGNPQDISMVLALHMYQYPGLKRGMMSLDARYTAMVDAGHLSARSQLLPLAIQYLAELEKDQPTLPPPDFIVY